MGPKCLTALRSCEGAVLGMWGFVEPSQCTGTMDEKIWLKWERVQIKLEDCWTRDDLWRCFRFPAALHFGEEFVEKVLLVFL